MRSPYLPLPAIVLALAMTPSAFADEPAGRPALSDPSILLVRDEAVRAALAFSTEQRAAIDALFGKYNRLLLAIRDVGPTGADETAQAPLAEIRSELSKLLTGEQRSRLQGLILQAQGYDALLRNDVSEALKLSPEQKKTLIKASDEFRADVKELQSSAKGRSPANLQAALAKVQASRHKRVLAELDAEQTRRWSQLLGEPFDFSQVRPSPASAPEFESIDAWLNSPPLTMESLRGQVVVVHFFAFGCSNCINNYPWYREWQNDLAGKGVTIVGIHAPETEAETDNEQLRLSLEKHELKFPVAVDKEKKMWQAYHNGIWPTVYIVDKQGRVRYWWYGELDWQGAGNQKNVRRQIEQLLAEP
ncbi:MAG: redoxin domain-containing protein [Planctomycetes bacterium]|nr:redoxin domain-containing protein [Planctomycetota bacterium]